MTRIATLVLALVASLAVPVLSPAAAHPAIPSARSRVSTKTLLAQLPVAPAHAAGYARAKFKEWDDPDQDGCDTREEVLIAEAKTPPRVGAGCTLRNGSWTSPYDDVTTSDPATLTVDHVVPLAEAWRSGAYTWTAKTRERFANDLGYGSALVAVSWHAAHLKGDREPSAYLPPRTAFDCTYLAWWVAVKWRWHLSVDRAEKSWLTQHLKGCGWPTAFRPSRPSIGTPVPLLPIQQQGGHPGAAALVGDAPTPANGTLIPSAARQFLDRPSIGYCQVGHDASVPRFCGFGDTRHPILTIALVGDSLAGQWVSALNEIGKAHHWKIVIALHSRCPFGATMSVDPGTTAPYTPCHTWGVAVLHTLLTTLHPDLVLVGDRPVMGTLHHRPGAAASTEIGRGMATYWRELLAEHTAVAGFRESPELAASGDTPRRAALPATTPITVANRLLPRSSWVINMSNAICDPTMCRTVVGNVRVYRDLHHLTRTYTLTAAPYLERKLLRIPTLADG